MGRLRATWRGALVVSPRRWRGELSLMAEQPWVSDPYGAEDAPSVLRLARDVWGDVEVADADYLEWQYERNPAGKVIAQLAREGAGGRVVAQYVTVPVRVQLAGHIYTASIALNVATDAPYRGRGIFPALAEAVNRRSTAEGVAFSYAFPNDDSFPGFVNRFGFRHIGSAPLLLRLVNVERLVSRRFGRRWLRILARPASRLLAPDLQSERRMVHPDVQVVRVERFGDEADEFWSRVGGREPVMIVRDASYLNWRFVDIPQRKYVALEALADGVVVGFLVLRCAELRGYAAGLIVDFLVEPGPRGARAGERLLDEALAHFAEHDLDLLGSLALPHSVEYRLIRSRGFWRCPRWLEPQPFRLVVRWHLAPDAMPDTLYDVHKWFITMGDYDIG